MPKIPIGLQLYTLRDDAEKDFAGTVRKVAALGYSSVELAGHGGLSVRELSALLEDNHLTVAGSHIPLETLEADLAKVIEENLKLGNTHIVVPYLAAERRKDADGYKQLAGILTGFGETLQTAGLTLCYHNHDFEFLPLEDGRLGEDILLENSDPNFVKIEADAYWIMKAGQDPVAFVKQHPGRVPIVHLKDRDLTDGSFAPVGTGDLPLDALIAAALASGTKHFLVEQDLCKIPPMDAVTLSYNNLKAKGYA